MSEIAILSPTTSATRTTPITDPAAWLREALTAGPKAAAEVLAAAERAGITRKRLRTARERLGVLVDREGFGPGSRIVWALSAAPIAANAGRSIDAPTASERDDLSVRSGRPPMEPAALLADLEALGVILRAEGNRLMVDAPAGVLTADHHAALAEHKSALLRLLAAEADALGRADGDRSFGATQLPSTGVTGAVASQLPPAGVAGSAIAPLPSTGVSGGVASQLPPAGVGCSFTRDARDQQNADYDATPGDAGRALLAWGAGHNYPTLQFKPGESIPAGEQGWRGFVSWAPHDRLILALEARGASGRRCALLGCWSQRGHGDLFYCPEHRLRADAGLLWAADAASETPRNGQECALGASGSSKGPNWTPGTTHG
jgi:hypothetical protein